MSIFICIAEQLLICLEDESEKFEAVVEVNEYSQYNCGPNYQNNRLNRRYMKLERIYQLQSKEYDNYSNTMHPHQFLTTHFFEVQGQAKDHKIKKDIQHLEERLSNV